MDISWLSKFWSLLRKPDVLPRPSQATDEDNEHRRLIDSSPQPIFVQSQDIVVYANKAAAELLGASHTKELIGRNIETLVHADFHAIVRKRIKSVLTENVISPTLEEKMVRLDGALVDVEVRASRVFYRGQEAIQVVMHDITGRKQTEAALRASEEHFRAFMELIPAFVSIKDTEGRFVYLNSPSRQLHGVPVSQMIGHTNWDSLPPESAERILEKEQSILVSGPSQHIIEDLILSDGSAHSFLLIKFPLKEASGRDLLAGIALDITARIQAENALRDSQRRLQLILSNLPVMLFGVDQDGLITLSEGQGLREAGLAERNRVGHAIWTCYSDVPQMIECARRGLSGESFDAEVEVNGRILQIFVTPLRNEKNFNDGFLTVALDITERRRAETTQRELLMRLTTAQEEERWRIARDLHDQLGQDLAVLMLGLKSLGKNHHLTPAANLCIEELQGTVNTLVQHVRQIALNLRSEALGTLGLSAALRRYSDEWSHHHGIEVVFHDWGFQNRAVAPHIEATIYRVVQEAFTNVLRHANATHVSLFLEHRDDHVLAIIEDNGHGFDVEAVEQRPLTARGLGLRGMKERVTLVNGSLQIEARDGDGTTIYVRVPTTGVEEEPLLDIMSVRH